MSLVTMLLAAVHGLSQVIDPCHPPVPCDVNSNMSDPHGDCTVYFICHSSTGHWQRTYCRAQDNETSYYDLVTRLCLVDALNPTCHDHCPGEFFHNNQPYSRQWTEDTYVG